MTSKTFTICARGDATPDIVLDAFETTGAETLAGDWQGDLTRFHGLLSTLAFTAFCPGTE